MSSIARLRAACLAAVVLLLVAGRAAAGDTFNLPSQFSDMQGRDGWRYVILDDLDNAWEASWDNEVAPWGPRGHASWNGGPGFSGPPYLEVTGRDLADWTIPGGGGWLQGGEHVNFAFAWTAPLDGTVHVGAMVNTAYFYPRPGPWWCNSPTPGWCEDGVWVSIWKNGAQVTNEVRAFTGRTEADRLEAGFLAADIDVAAGDELWYKVRRGAWQDADGIYYSVTISYDDDVDLTPPESSHELKGRILLLSATDDMSGVASLEAYWVEPATSSWTREHAWVLEPGSYALGYRGVDMTGNVEPVHRVWLTIPATSDLPTLIETLEGACMAGWITKPGICHSLQVKLDAAEDSAERGQLRTERHQLEAFLHELNAQAGKAVTDKAYEVLSADVQALIDALP